VTASARFFEAQFRRQVSVGEFDLNPFERLALPYLHDEVLDLGCGLGNLALAAARAGCRVTALDGSATAIDRIRATALADGLEVEARVADLTHFALARDYDCIVAIGLLMFLPQASAEALLTDIVSHVRPEGVVVLNVLTQGTTYLGMFESGHYHLFPRGALQSAVAGWEVLASCHETFAAPNETAKVFDTLIARRPSADLTL
jgi:tellurite methyltransferase